MANIAVQRIKREFKEVVKSEEVSFGLFARLCFAPMLFVSVFVSVCAFICSSL